jgi:hypothetical protein
MEALQILVPFLGVILGIFIGYFLKQAEYERKRRDDLADRELDRRTKVRDRCIEEARIYLDTYWNVAQTLSIHEMFLGAGVEKGVTKEQENYILNTMLENRKRVSSIYSLDDAELNLLHGVLDAVYSTENEQKLELENFISSGEPVDHDAVIDRVQSFNTVMHQYITKMKIRLDKLASGLK